MIETIAPIALVSLPVAIMSGGGGALMMNVACVKCQPFHLSAVYDRVHKLDWERARTVPRLVSMQMVHRLDRLACCRRGG